MQKRPTEAVSSFLRKKKKFSLNKLVTATGIERKKLLRVCEKFRKEGILQIIEEENIRPARGENGPFRRNPRYERIKDVALRPTRQRPVNERDKIWRTIRFLRRMKRSDLTRLTGCNESTVSVYTRKLVIHGYLKELGRNGREKVFFLIKDTGPKRPIIAGE